MSTIKISQLPIQTALESNTSNTLFIVNNANTGITGKVTATTIASGLYSNNALVVGLNQIVFPNTVAQFSLTSNTYIQTNLQNIGNDFGTADHVVTANTGTNSSYYIDLGYANKNYNNTNVNNSLGTALNALDGYLYVQGAGTGQPGGNLVVGTTTSGTKINFIVGGVNSSNISATLTQQNLQVNVPITFADGSSQNTAAATLAYTQAAFNLANTSNVAIVYQNGVDITQNTNTQLAFNKANTALSNVNGVITTGNMTVSGNLIVAGVGAAGLFSVNATPYFANTPAVSITGSNNFATVAPGNQGYMLQVTGFANSASRVVNDSFGVGGYPAYIGRAGRGTAFAPTATQSGDILLRISGNGYANTFSQFGQGRIDIVATENYTDTTKGSQIQFWNTQVGTNNLVQIASFNGVQANFYGYINPQKGFIYTPLTYPAAQTAITIDMANNSLVRAQTSAGLTATLSNLLTGKLVELWVTNTAVGNQNFTHGLAAINSTTNSTAYTIPGTSTIQVKYMCFDGTLQNTFVSIIHA